MKIVICGLEMLPPARLRVRAAALLIALGVGSGCPAGAGTNSIQPVLSLDLGERFDSNVMLQNVGAQANQESLVTSVMPVVGGRWRGQGQTPYSVGLKYAPDFTFFHDLSRESYLRHIGIFDFDVKREGLAVNSMVSASYTDGSTEPPTWGTAADPGATPSLGAVEVRNRRRNMYFVSKLVGRQELGRTFLRGTFDARIWDFMTEDLFPPETPNPTQLTIQNYYDRSDINGGVDVGVKLEAKTELSVGYRLGHQDQEARALPPYPLPAPNSRNSYSYANLYHRFPIGLKTRPCSGFTLTGEVGPSVHFFDAASIKPGTHVQQDYLYFLASGAIQLATNTCFKVTGGQYLLPASAGNGVYQNLTATGTLEQKLSHKLRAAFLFGYTEYDFDAEFQRWDRVFVPEARVDYAFNPHLSAGLWYSYSWSLSLIPNTANREYTRNIVGIGLKATY
jgi:hypothetical protein